VATKRKAKKPAKKPVKKIKALPPLRELSRVYVSKKFQLPPFRESVHRADIIFEGVDHAGASFEARVFLNNPDANDKTPRRLESGYAGTFYIFGHGGCFGDVGHCEVHGARRPYDPRPAHPLTPARKTLIATPALRRAADQGKEVTVTVVPIVRAGTLKTDHKDVFQCKQISVVTYG
jgi:hypothetical protein